MFYLAHGWGRFEGGGSCFLFSLSFLGFLVAVVYTMCTLVRPFLALLNTISIYFSK